MQRALDLARQAAVADEVPVGAVVVLEKNLDGQPMAEPLIVAECFNNRETSQNPVGHAEVMALQQAAHKLGRWRLSGCTLYVTLEPCVMCAGAIVLSRVDRLVYGATDPKAGAVESVYKIISDKKLNHHPEVIAGIESKACSDLLKNFFAAKR